MTESIADEERELQRNRRTLLLLVVGAVSLLIPLITMAYVRLNEASRRSAANMPAGAVFERRAGDASAAKIVPAMAPAPLSPTSPMAQSPATPAPSEASAAPRGPGGSLSFVRGGDDYFKEQAPAASAPPPAAAPATPATLSSREPAQEPAPSKPKTGPKTFAAPKLRQASGFANYRSGAKVKPDEDPRGADSQKGAEALSLPDISGMLKNLPGGDSK